MALGWPSGDVVLAVCCAVGGAACFGVGSAAQQRATKQVPRERALHPRLLLALVRQPLWVTGVLGLVVGLSLQILALAFGPLVLVQPLGVTSALFGAVSGAWLARRGLDRFVVFGALACAGGLAVFLVLARPTAPATESLHPSLPLVVILALVLAVALVVASRGTGEVHALALALAAGVFYGVTAGLIKVVAAQIRADGIGGPLHHWTLLIACVTGPPGFLLSQNAFQQGRLVALALAVLTTVDPLVAVAVGVGWLGERVVTTPLALLGETVAGAAIVGGVVVLAQRGERLRGTDIDDTVSDVIISG